MGQKKLIKFAAIKEYENVLEYPQDMQGKWTAFFEALVKDTSPIDTAKLNTSALTSPDEITSSKSLTLELACGRGEYAVGLGRMFPTQNFIGVDLKGNRIWKGASIANKEGLKNIAFVRTQIELTPNYFAKDEVDEIWITFPDPQLRWSKAKKRLTHPKFLRLYQQFLKGGEGKDIVSINSNNNSDNNSSSITTKVNSSAAGIVHLKTDSPLLYNFTLKVIELYGLNLIYKTENLYAEATIDPRCLIKTYYEGLDIAQSNKIHYIQFNIDKELPLALDEVLKEAIKDIPMDAGELLRMEAEAAREKKED